MNDLRFRLSARKLPADRIFSNNFIPGISLIFSLLISSQLYAQSDAPTIRLFPTTVVEDLRQTSFVAKEMESGLQEVIGRLDQQQQLYLESKCDGAEDDPGCQRLSRQLGATYLEMLTIMEERLPDMEHTVNNTRLSLEKRLRSELGNKMTSWTLQETLLGGNPHGTSAPSPTMRGRWFLLVLPRPGRQL